MKKVYWIILGIFLILITVSAILWWNWTTRLCGNCSKPSVMTSISSIISTASPSQVSISPALTSKVKIFLIAPDDDGKTGKAVGCGDSIVGVEVEVEPTQAVLKAAYEKLLSIKTADYGQSGLKNALSNSNLVFESANIKDGQATILLSGSLNSAGSCEDPRIQAQLEETARQFSTVSSIEIFLNGKPLNNYLSSEGPGA